MGPTRVADIRIELADIRPPIWRRVAVPLDMSLADLHMVIQVAMGWFNSHLWEFEIDGRSCGVSGLKDEPVWGDEILDARSLRLGRLIERGVTKFNYLYDFGDSWRHRIIVRSVEPAGRGMSYPRFLAGKRRCPPEDVGGVPGYRHFIDALANPDNAENSELLKWYGAPYDPESLDTEKIAAALTGIGDRRRRRK